MIKTVGVCGYISTGSSAFVDLLHEFDETQVLDIEVSFVRREHGLEDLEYFLKKRGSFSALTQFISFFTEYKFFGIQGREKIDKAALDKALDDFLNKIVSNSQGHSYRNYIKNKKNTILKNIGKKVRKYLPAAIYRNATKRFRPNFEVMPEYFDAASRNFVFDVLKAFDINCYNKDKNVLVLNQPFNARDPITSFKYFENPMAIIVDRDPRDHYLFCKYFLHPRGLFVFPSDNVNDYIKWFRNKRFSPSGLRDRKDIIFINFEELVYDSENAIKKVTDFVGITKHIRKGECFKSSHSRNNTKLFLKYTECESDIKKIERELPEYIFPFENFPDIEPEGGMFYGSQTRKITKPIAEYIRDVKKGKY